MNAKKFMFGIIDWWFNHMRPRMDSLSIELPLEKKKSLVKELRLGLRDQPLDGDEFIWKLLTIDGNDKLCVQGTILDVQSKSLVSDHFARIVFLIRLYYKFLEGNVEIYKDRWNGIDFSDEKNIVLEIHKFSNEFFGAGGVLEQAKAMIENGDWINTIN